MKKTIPQMEPWFDNQEANALYRYMRSGAWGTEFKKTQELEEAICLFTKSPYCVMTNNGTVSLILCLLALGLTPGDEILVPNLTMIATPNAASLLGLKPVLVDVDKETLCLDLTKATRFVNSRTKALVYVAFNGRSGNMKEVLVFCKKNGLALIEDAAQALGSYHHGKHLGTFGNLGSFSFSVPKIITTGQGGAVVTNDRSLYRKVRGLKDFGRSKGATDRHDHWGWNFKFTDIQAVIGLEQMKKLPFRLVRKKQIYKKYFDQLADVKQISFVKTDLSQTAPWFIDVFVPDPNKLQAYLARLSIASRRIYPPISSQKIYQKDYRSESFPMSAYYARRGLWLPSSTKLTDQEIMIVAKAIRKYYS